MRWRRQEASQALNALFTEENESSACDGMHDARADRVYVTKARSMEKAEEWEAKNK